MATLPDYVCIEHGGWAEQPVPPVERTEMERGPAKEMRTNSRIRWEVTARFLFKSPEHAIAFEDWYQNTIGVIGYFDLVHPLRGTTISAKFIAGDIGELAPRGRGFQVSSREVRLEYMR